jgi:hypothetical protein
MQEWQQRPAEVAHLFNPAFCGTLIAKTAETYSSAAGHGLQFGLVFLILPIILHEETRTSLPRGTVTSFLAWIENHQAQLIGFPDRVRRLRPVTQEAVMFNLAHRIMRVADDGDLVPGEVTVSSTTTALRPLTPDAQDCIRKSLFLGRWLAAAGTPSTIMASWGIAP